MQHSSKVVWAIFSPRQWGFGRINISMTVRHQKRFEACGVNVSKTISLSPSLLTDKRTGLSQKIIWISALKPTCQIMYRISCHGIHYMTGFRTRCILFAKKLHMIYTVCIPWLSLQNWQARLLCADSDFFLAQCGGGGDRQSTCVSSVATMNVPLSVDCRGVDTNIWRNAQL